MRPIRASSGVRYLSLCVALVVAVATAACRTPQAPPSEAEEPWFEFALIGDNPYPERNVPKFEALIQDVNLATGLEWVLHLGDIQGGSLAQTNCSREDSICISSSCR